MPATTFCARRYDTGEAVRITFAGDKIAAIEPAWPDGPIAAWPFVAPGLFDLQINGYGGVWFTDPGLTPSKVLAAIEPYFAHGVTRLCPTLITDSHAALSAGFACNSLNACEEHRWLDHVIPGCHLEGPYPVRRGWSAWSASQSPHPSGRLGRILRSAKTIGEPHPAGDDRPRGAIRDRILSVVRWKRECGLPLATRQQPANRFGPPSTPERRSARTWGTGRTRSSAGIRITSGSNWANRG